MPLSLVATPIGNPRDISLRALDCLKDCDLIVCEEPKPARAILKSLGLSPQKEMLQLNEHSTKSDVDELKEICKKQHVALITDCGTPGFCDPGAHLVKACRQAEVSINVLPGASSLMTALSYSGERIDHFNFVGFLPAKNEERKKAIQKLKNEKSPLVILDTPYRLKALINDLQVMAPRQALLCLDLTSENEKILSGSLKKIRDTLDREKAEFVLILYPA